MRHINYDSCVLHVEEFIFEFKLQGQDRIA